MGRFNEYPYVNYNEYNLDWVIKKVKELALAWIELNKDNDKFKNDLLAAMDDLREYVDDYFENLDITEEVTEAIDEEIDRLINSGYFLRVIGNNAKGMASANLIAEYSANVDRYEGYASGMCYIGNSQFVTYIHIINEDNYGYLTCIDISTHTAIWSHKLLLYHGNTLCYNPATRLIYVASTENAVGDPLPYVFVIDRDNPSTILRTITLPGGMRASNVAYDDVNDAFYIIGGRVANTYQAIEFNGEYDTIKRVLQLEQTYYTKAVMDTYYQGCTIAGGILYQMYFNQYQCVIGYDLTDGHMTTIANIPHFFNGCKHVFEYEDITFDYDRSVFTASSQSQSYRIHGCPIINLVDLGIVNEIPVAYLPAMFARSGSITYELSVDVADTNDTTPVTQSGIFRGIPDAEYYNSVRWCNSEAMYAIRNSATHDARINNAFFGYSFQIRPSAGNTLTIFNADLTAVQSAVFRNCTIMGNGNFGGEVAMLGVSRGQSLYIDGVTFSVSDNGINYGIYCDIGSYVKILSGCTITGENALEMVYMKNGGKLDLMAHNMTGAQAATYFHIDNRTTCEISASYECYTGTVAANTTVDFTKYGTKQGIIALTALDYRNASTFIPFSVYSSADTTQLQTNVMIIPTDDGYIKANVAVSWVQLRVGTITKVFHDGTTTSLSSLNVCVTCMPA